MLFQLYFTEFNRYFTAFFMALYTYESFSIVVSDSEKKRNRKYLIQNICIASVVFSNFLSLTFVTSDYRYLFFCGFELILLFTFLSLFSMIYPGGNRLLLHHMCLFLAIGLLVLSRLDTHKAMKQSVIAVVALVIGMSLPAFRRWLVKLEHVWLLFALLGIGLLTGVMLWGSMTNGSKLSVSIGGLSVQMSELVKITFAFFLAGAFTKKTGFSRVFSVAGLAGIHIIVLVLSRDLGSGLIFFLTFLLTVFLITGKKIYLFLGLFGGSGAAVVAYRLFSHVRVRVQAWSNPWDVIDGIGYQITQSLFALGGGGLFGTGIGKGVPEKIPYVEFDFIFSAIGEEFGILFAACLVLVGISSFLVFVNGFLKQRNTFCGYLSLILGLVYMIQLFLTIGGGTKSIPLTGVTFPFVSYGGSSLVSTIVLFLIEEGIYCLLKDKVLPVKTDDSIAETILEKEEVCVQIKNRTVGLTYCFVVLFLGMLCYTGWLCIANQPQWFSNNYNTRQYLVSEQIERGTIYAGSGEVLARTVPLENGEVREYPFENLFAHVVGYTGKGRAGIEAMANYDLLQSGLSTGEKIENQAKGIKNPGNDVYTTLDVTLQQKADEALEGYKGAVIVTEVGTGRILAMVSKPDFNPNTIVEDWETLIGEEESGVLINRSTQGLYPPGSTFKIITALEAIRQEKDLLSFYEYECQGSFVHDTGEIHCYHEKKHGLVSFTDSFAQSCNASFANIGKGLERTAFQKTLEELLFNVKLPVDFVSNKSSIAVNKETEETEMLQIAIGQGSTLMSPLHINMITGAIADGGILWKPYLIERVQNADGKLIRQYDAKILEKEFLTVAEADSLKEMMTEVVENGTAFRLSGLSYSVAGKTGSAEYNNRKGDSHAWFTGFAPARNPEICVTVIIEGAGSGGEYAVPVAKEVFDCYFSSKEQN